MALTYRLLKDTFRHVINNSELIEGIPYCHFPIYSDAKTLRQLPNFLGADSIKVSRSDSYYRGRSRTRWIRLFPVNVGMAKVYLSRLEQMAEQRKNHGSFTELDGFEIELRDLSNI